MDLRIYPISDAPDVNTTGRITGQVLSWNSVTGKYDHVTVSSANFANTDLTFDATRQHDAAGFDLLISSDNGALAQSWFYLGQSNVRTEIGYANTWDRWEAASKTTFINNASTGTLFHLDKQIGIGASPASLTTLDVRAGGALSTNILFRARNSADTFDLFNILGDGQVWSNGKGGVASNTNYGKNALIANTTGSNSTAIGSGALATQVTNGYNTAVGVSSQYYNNAGDYNTSLGFASLLNSTQNNFTGVGNIGIGYYGGATIASGSYNICIGYSAGATLRTGNGNTLIGRTVDVPLLSTTDNVVISDGSGTAGKNAIWKDANNFIGFGYNHITDTLGSKVDIKGLGTGDANITFRIKDSLGANIGIEVLGSNKIGFYGASPVARGAAVADATDAATAITQLNALLARMRVTGGNGLIAD